MLKTILRKAIPWLVAVLVLVVVYLILAATGCLNTIWDTDIGLGTFLIIVSIPLAMVAGATVLWLKSRRKRHSARTPAAPVASAATGTTTTTAAATTATTTTTRSERWYSRAPVAIVKLAACLAALAILAWIIVAGVVGIARACSSGSHAKENVACAQDGRLTESERLSVPCNARKVLLTSDEEWEVYPASPGKYWHLEVKDTSAILEYRAFNILPDGSKEFVGKWRCGNAVGKSVNFPTADKYLVKVNKKEVPVLWFEN